ncbi:MAG: DUF333 domain-containing protein [Pseudomonadota bacterium]
MKGLKLMALGGCALAVTGAQAAEGTATLIANPAAEFCLDTGGDYRIVKAAEGERGVCVLPDGEEVDAWAYFRAETEHAPQEGSDGDGTGTGTGTGTGAGTGHAD